MPRKSVEAQLHAVPVQGRRVEPYVDLPTPAKKIWAELVDALPPNRFHASDRPLLALYCRALHQTALAFANLEKYGASNGEAISPWLKVADTAGKQAATLATKLRLCPQARVDRKTAGSAATKPRPETFPWE